jgi:hypothetical protein
MVLALFQADILGFVLLEEQERGVYADPPIQRSKEPDRLWREEICHEA